MFVLLLAGASIIALAALVPLYFAVKNAAKGYEDSRGFHGGD